MGQSVSQGITSTQFFLYGKSRFTRTGWEKASKSYTNPNALEEANLGGRIYLVTGANSGLGFAISEYLVSKGAKVYLVCRNKERGEQAVAEIAAKGFGTPELLLGDCGLKSDVDRLVEEFSTRESKLDGLVCNAGALLNERTVTSEGVEVTLATHLLFGSYRLTQLSLPLLKRAEDPRVIFVSSGGMYNTKFPSWARAASLIEGSYRGDMAYSYAKRGQVLLAQQLTGKHDHVKFVSCHPGWTDTPGVASAFGDQKKYLEPMRNLYQGAEGIMWLCVAPGQEIQSGEFYLDRTPQRLHLSGPFFSDGSFTKNTPEEIANMMEKLEAWSVADPETLKTMIDQSTPTPRL